MVLSIREVWEGDQNVQKMVHMVYRYPYVYFGTPYLFKTGFQNSTLKPNNLVTIRKILIVSSRYTKMYPSAINHNV